MDTHIGLWLRKRFVVTVVAVALGIIGEQAAAHDFWLGVGGSDAGPTVKQFFGESYPDGTQFAMDASLVTRFDVITEDSTESLLSHARAFHGKEAVPLETDSRPAKDPALIVIDHGFIEHHMSSDTFHEYVHHEALSSAHGHDNRDVQREIYARTLKTYLRGSKRDGAGIFRRRAAQPLEIILCDNPTLLAPGGHFDVQVLYKGRPLANHRVSAISSFGDGARRRQDLMTDADGFARFSLTRTGDWLIRSMHLVPCAQGADCEDIDWLSYWSAFTFDVPGGSRNPPGSID